MPRDPKKINSYVVLDFETGGLDPTKNPIMSFAAIALNGVTLEEIVRYENLVRPYDDSLYYDPRAMAVNNLTVEMCINEGVPLKQLVDDICTVFKEANLHNTKTAKPLLVGHNLETFDTNFLIDIFHRCNVDMSTLVHGAKDVNGTFQPSVLDTISWNKAMTAELTDNDTKFKLGVCCERAGINVNNAHNAMGDVVATADLLRYMITRLRSGSSTVSVSEGKAVVQHRHSWEW